jgi:cytochrome c553
MTRRVLLISASLAAVGFLVAASGIIPIKASSGHWAVTEWLLQFGKRRSIATHSLGTQAPSLDDADLILKGAMHYEIGCRSCHGSPGVRQPRIAQRMLPPPPPLGPLVPERSPEQLFQVVKHGLKFTGMPAWPAQERDDEVWAVVAFLQKLPDLSDAEYRKLVQEPPSATAPIETLGVSPRIPKPVTDSCARCHGSDGIARGNGAFPHLANQRPEYLHNALEAYARGERHSGIMEPIAAALTVETIDELARYYASAEPRARSTAARDQASIERGRLIATEGVREHRIAACVECHDPQGRRAKPAYPSLAGQPAKYLELQLRLFKEGQRGGSEFAHLMRPIAQRLTPEQARDVSRYFEALPFGQSAAPVANDRARARSE